MGADLEGGRVVQRRLVHVLDEQIFERGAQFRLVGATLIQASLKVRDQVDRTEIVEEAHGFAQIASLEQTDRRRVDQLVDHTKIVVVGVVRFK